MKKWILLACLPFFLSAQDYYGEVPETFSAKVINKSVHLTLDDLGKMDLEVSYPSDYLMKEIELPSSEQGAEIQYSLAKASLSEANEKKETQSLSIEFEPQVEGTYHLDLPLLHFESKGEPLNRHTLYPPSIECEVRMSVEDPMEELEVASPLTLDASPPIELDVYNKKVFFQKSEDELKEVHQKFLNQAPTMHWKWFVWALAVGFVAYKIYQLMTRKRTFQNLFSVKEDPREKALRDLKKLKAKNLPKKGEYDAFYVGITQIVRQYIESRYKIKAPEQTTQEFLNVMLGQSAFSETINHYLTEFLKFADLVKFAKLSPKVEDCSQAEEAAESFILSESEK